MTVDIRSGYYGLVNYDKNGNEIGFQRIGKKISLRKILKNIETGEITWYLTFDYKGETVAVEFERGNFLDKNSAKILTQKGADIKSRNIDVAMESILIQEQQVQVMNTFCNTGWLFLNSQIQYRGNTLIGGNGIYRGKYKLNTMGSFEEWQNMMRNEIIGFPSLEVVMLASLSAVVNGVIAPLTTGENPIVHISLASGKGKSTIGYAACSVYGEPFEGSRRVSDNKGRTKIVKSVFGSWASTENALITDNCGNHGTCVILNEIGKYTGKDLTPVVYGLSDGVDKNRLNEKYTGEVKENFCTTFLSIGESSLIQKCKVKEQGVNIRVMEIDSPLTVDAEHSRRIKKLSRENNGWAAEKLAEHIINSGGADYVLEIYQKTLEQLSAGETSGEKIRFTEKFTALFVTTAILCKEALELAFSIDEDIAFCNLCWDQKVSDDGDVHKSYYDVLEKLRVHESNFYSDNNNYVPLKEVWGRVSHPNIERDGKILTTEYAVRSETLRGLLKELQYNNYSTCLKKWRDCGVLDHESQKLLNRRVIVPKGEKESVYVIQVWEPTTDKNNSGGYNEQ